MRQPLWWAWKSEMVLIIRRGRKEKKMSWRRKLQGAVVQWSQRQGGATKLTHGTLEPESINN